ncbi:MAG: DUF1553 domain-containing protein, partial [Planctomycetota bacterium]
SQHSTEQKWVQLDLGESRRIREVRLIPAFDPFNNIGAGFGFPVRYRVEAADDASFQEGVRRLNDAANVDQPNPKTRVITIRGDGISFRYLRVTATKLRERRDDFIFALGELEVIDEESSENLARNATVTAKDSIESGVRWGKANLVDGVFYREVANEAARSELQALRAQRADIEAAMRPGDMDERLAAMAKELRNLRQELKTFPAGRLVYAASTDFTSGGHFIATNGKPRPIHLLHRGDLTLPGERMVPGALPLWEGALSEFSQGNWDLNGSWREADARATLARYLTRQDNPLVWRSIANRLWLWTFGSPLVGTPNDFGRGGMQPTHPRLLDYLAQRLRDDPQQSMKAVIRLLVTSQAYRRSSRIDPTMARRDLGNDFRWRANRRRLTAEEFRDTLLTAAGVLQRTVGGESFQDFLIDKPQHSPHYEYHLHDPADPNSHRRSVYRFVVRSQPQPLLTTLDCADPSVSAPRRDESTTALQALAAWNNRLVEFSARKLGDRLKNESSMPRRQIEFACRLVLGRDASRREMAILEEHLGDHGPASLARVLFNMNAFVYVD